MATTNNNNSSDSIILRLLDAIHSKSPSVVAALLREAQQQLPFDGNTSSSVAILPSPTPNDDWMNSIQQQTATFAALLQADPKLSHAKSSKDQSLPLHFAACLGILPVVKILYLHNPDAAVCKNAKGKTPLHFAAREGRLEVVNYLLDCAPQAAAILTDKRKLPLHFAAADGHRSVCRKLLQVYPQAARIVSSKGKNCLHFAARGGHADVARDILQWHPESLATPDAAYSLPLHDAVRGSQDVLCRMLVDMHPESVTAGNMRGEIPLYGAVRGGNLDLCAYFLAVWPNAGGHILRQANADDCVREWGWPLVELLLRGAVGNFAGAEQLHRRRLPPRNVRLNNRIAVAHFHEAPSATVRSAPRSSPTLQNPSFCGADDATTTSTTNISSQQQQPQKKRQKTNSNCHNIVGAVHDVITGGYPHSLNYTGPNPTRFLPLHAAIQSQVSLVSLAYIWKVCRTNHCRDIDAQKRTILHLAVAAQSSLMLDCASTRTNMNTANANDDNIILEMIQAVPNAAQLMDDRGRLPLHIALQQKASLPVIQALVHANPQSVVQCIQNDKNENDQWTPVELACHHNADLDVVFFLLSVDPSVVQRKRKKIAAAVVASL